MDSCAISELKVDLAPWHPSHASSVESDPPDFSKVTLRTMSYVKDSLRGPTVDLLVGQMVEQHSIEIVVIELPVRVELVN
jgi:hypothetical protein